MLAVAVATQAAPTAAREPVAAQWTTNVVPSQGRDLYLEVLVNGVSTQRIVLFHELPDKRLVGNAEALAAAGLIADAGAQTSDGRFSLDRLPDVAFRLDEATQRLLIETTDARRLARTIDASTKRRGAERLPVRADYGALVNYLLYASSGSLADGRLGEVDGFSGSFDTRLFGPFGTLDNAFIAGNAGHRTDEVTRVRTTWSYSDPERLLTYRVGDLVSGGLAWTRPVYLGGAQVQRNFALRSDLVTLPLPSFAGSAAVPSTLEVYTHNVLTYTGSVAPGPFEVVNLPVVAGDGEARVVLRDSQGRETVTTLPFFASTRLLREGLLYFSADAGVPRRGYGVDSFNYDDSPFAVLSARYGISDRLTLEGHVEAGEELLNGGIGAAFPLGHFGTASMAVAGSRHDDRAGVLANAALELRWRGWSLYGRLQRTFGDYDDIASVTARPDWYVPPGASMFTAEVPHAIDQVALNVPLPLQGAGMHLSYARVEGSSGYESRIVGASYSQQLLPRTTFRASLFADLGDDESYGVFAGLSFPLGNNIHGSVGYDQRGDEPALVADAIKTERQEPGSVGWRVRVSEGEVPSRSAAISYRAPFARFETSVYQYGSDVRATAQADGAIAFVGGGVFATTRVHDAFAVVDVGAPDVEVRHQNRKVGVTNSGGRILVPDLHAYEPNTLSIDPSNLPVDADVPTTKQVVVPAARSGVVVDFGVSAGPKTALVTFVDEVGKPLSVGLAGRLDGGLESFVVGYGGEAYVRGLGPANVVVIERPHGACRAEFPYQPSSGNQVRIDGVVCR